MVAAGFDRPIDGYRAERDEFVRLWETETSGNLIDPLHLIDAIGPSIMLDNLRRLHAFYGDASQR